MTDASVVMTAQRSQPLVDQAVVACPDCGAWNDVWAESCPCGTELLADTRKLKLMKSSGEPHARMERRAKGHEDSPQPADWEQAVRDLAALRAMNGTASYTPRITRLLLKLGRFDEALAQAMVMSDAGALPSDIAVAVAGHFETEADLENANAWIDRGLASCGADLKGRLPLVCARSRMLADHGSAREALAQLQPLKAELEAAIKKTEKGGGATFGSVLGGDPGTFARSFWGSESKTLNAAMEHVAGIVKEMDRAEHAAAKTAKVAQRAAEGKTHWWQ